MIAFSGKLTLMGLNYYDDDLFEYLEVPEGMDKELLVDTILLRCEELELVYPSFPVMKQLIGIWSKSEVDIWEKMFATENFEYNPLEPFDITEETTNDGYENENRNDTKTENNALSKNVIKNGSDSVNNTGYENDTANSTESVAAYNAETFKNARATSDSYNEAHGENTTRTKNDSESDSVTENNTILDSETRGLKKGSRKVSHTHGNMGSTSNQELIKEQREVANFCTYDFIAGSFKEKFCVRVY